MGGTVNNLAPLQIGWWGGTDPSQGKYFVGDGEAYKNAAIPDAKTALATFVSKELDQIANDSLGTQGYTGDKNSISGLSNDQLTKLAGLTPDNILAMLNAISPAQPNPATYTLPNNWNLLK